MSSLIARVRNIGAQLKLRNDQQQLLLQELMRVPNRTYLDIDIDKTGIVEATSHLPKTVDEAYGRILSRSHNFKEAKRLLHIIVAVERPLTLMEMSVALALRENHRSCGDFDPKLEERFRENEFLIQNSLANDHKSVQSNFKWKYSLRPQESHRILAEICIWHLLFGEFETHPLNVNTSMSSYVDSHVFLDYSSKHWTVHFNKSYIEADAVIQSLLRICDASSNSCMTWFRINWTSTHTYFPQNFTTLMIASYFGLEALVKHLLKTGGIHLNSMDDTYEQSALSWAAGNGFDVIVKLLFKGPRISLNSIVIVKLPFRKGAKVDSADRYGRTALSYAAWNEHVATVKLLLRAGARVNSWDEIGGAPLSHALCNGHNDVVELLLKKGTQVNSPDDISTALLLSAAEKGHEAVVELLLEKGADLESMGGAYSQTLLSLAAENGHEAVVKLLLQKGADLESEDCEYSQTPLSWATEKGHEAVVKLLLEKGANLESKDFSGCTPLLWPARDGHEAMVKLLLEKGAGLESKDKYSRTPLSLAAEKWHGVVGGLYRQTPLSWAAESGHEAVVRLLLENGADLESRDCGYGQHLSNRSQYIFS
ncbi:Ankyrin repeat-containing domain protein [Elaphomyces granulatus]